jgi:uncharacterized membrane protein HdeD (DUF308 family)
MIILIILFGLLTLLAGVIIVINPEIIFGYLRDNLDRPWLQLVAVAARLVLGILLIYTAGLSRFPLIIELLGWLSIAAAITFALMGRQRFLKLMSWAFSLLKPYGRIGGLFAMAFGGFLVYAYI